MALLADVAGPHVVEPGRVDDEGQRRVLDVLAAGTMTFLAAHIPLGDVLFRNGVVDGMAAVAGRAGGAFQVVLAVVWNPPIGSLRHVIRTPLLVRHVPLRRQRKIVVANSREVALLPLAA